MNSKNYGSFHERSISDTQKIVVHLISFNKKPPVLACQHMWRENVNAEWNFGKMAVMNEEIIKSMIDNDVLKKALDKINELKTGQQE